MAHIPSSTVYSSEPGDSGVVVFAIQKALNATAAKDENKVIVDHDYGPSTEDAVGRFQEKKDLGADGVFGPATSKAMAIVLPDRARTAIPKGLLRGLIEGESGNLIGAVNHSVAGGVDCSYCQRRVYASDYDDLAVCCRAFDPLYQVNLFATRLRGQYEIHRRRGNNEEYAWRLATLNHNYPYAAEQYSLDKWPSGYATTDQAWVMNVGARFPDGDLITTPHEWCQHYALGAPQHNDPGTMVKYVNW